MSIVTLLGIVYLIGIFCIWVMRKLEPGNKNYTIWVIAVCAFLTFFVVCHAS